MERILNQSLDYCKFTVRKNKLGTYLKMRSLSIMHIDISIQIILLFEDKYRLHDGT